MNNSVAEAMTAKTEDAKPVFRVFQFSSVLRPTVPQTQRMESEGAIANSFSVINYYINILFKYTS